MNNKVPLFCLALLSLLSLSACQQPESVVTDSEPLAKVPLCQSTDSNQSIVTAYQNQQSDIQVIGCGTLIKALPDDNKGSRHQKLLIELDQVTPKHTVLLVHNIDLAPRVAEVSPGTPVSFYGEYVYNDKGGLVHWTHHDPASRHQDGWIDSDGVRYQ